MTTNSLAGALVGQFLRFCLAGGGGLVVCLLLTHALVAVFHLWYFYAYLIATVCGWSFIFAVNAGITFPDGGRRGYALRYVLFVSGYIAVFYVNATLVYIGTSRLGLHYLVSITIATVITASLNFLFSKFVVYRSWRRGDA